MSSSQIEKGLEYDAYNLFLRRKGLDIMVPKHAVNYLHAGDGEHRQAFLAKMSKGEVVEGAIISVEGRRDLSTELRRWVEATTKVIGRRPCNRGRE